MRRQRAYTSCRSASTGTCWDGAGGLSSGAVSGQLPVGTRHLRAASTCSWISTPATGASTCLPSSGRWGSCSATPSTSGPRSTRSSATRWRQKQPRSDRPQRRALPPLRHRAPSPWSDPCRKRWGRKPGTWDLWDREVVPGVLRAQLQPRTSGTGPAKREDTGGMVHQPPPPHVPFRPLHTRRRAADLNQRRQSEQATREPGEGFGVEL